MTVAELRKKAKELGIKGTSGMLKMTLIRVIEEKESEMKYEEFKNEIINKIKNYLPSRFADAKVSINKVVKNNEELDGLTILEKGNSISPTIYINEYYKSGKPMEKILQEIADIRIKHDVSMESIDISWISDWERVKPRLQKRIFGMKNNVVLNNRPYIPYAGNLAITFCVFLEETSNGTQTIPVTNQLMENWNITVEDLLDSAQNENYICKSMTETMIEMMLPQVMIDTGMSEEEALEYIKSMLPPDDPMYVLTNDKKQNGAVCITDIEFLKKVREKVGKDFYILPSSIHELLVVPVGVMEVSELVKMVGEVNETQVAPQDRLSYSVYKFRNETVTIA